MAKLSATKIKETVIIFGDPKTGKTTYAAQLAIKHKVKWFDLENGSSTLLKLPHEAQANIELIKLPNILADSRAFATILHMFKLLPTTYCIEHGVVECPVCKKAGAAFDTIQLGQDSDEILVFDSLTELTAGIEAKITKGSPDDYKYEFDDYRKLGGYLDIFFGFVQSGRHNVVCITHAGEVASTDGTKKIVPIAGTSKYSRYTARFFRHAIYMEIKAARHRAVSKSTAYPNVITGSSTDVDTMTGGTLEDIFKLS